jgi:threonine dehydrogenase-like Zn-dependent dehydrogenase
VSLSRVYLEWIRSLDLILGRSLIGDCFYCHRGYFSRCVQAQCIGGPGIEGAQAEYLRVPLADATLLPTPADMPEELMLLMADILPTGYSVAWHARRLADEDREPLGADGGLSGAQEKHKGGVCVVVGCGPVSRRSRGFWASIRSRWRG